MPARVDTFNEASPVSRIEAWLPVDAIASTRREAQERFDRMDLGQRLQASVVAKLDDGSFLVEMLGLRTRMQLPADTRVGQKLTLSLTSHSPQTSFQIEPETSTSTTSLSAGARMIDSALFAQRDQDTPPVVTGKTPVMNAPGMPATQIAEALRHSIASSGLFYESHVAEWASNGANNEPNNGPHTGTSSTQVATMNLPDHVKPGDVHGSNPSIQSLAREPQQQLTRSTDAQNPVADELPPDVKQALVQLVGAQLDTLEHHRLVWQGEAWPGQHMLLEMTQQGLGPDDLWERDPGQGAGQEPDSNDASKAVWQTSLKIRLPHMGAVTAQIQMIGERVRLDIEGEDASAVQRLQQRRPTLARSMENAGLGLMALTVSAGSE